jgi:hypothetical protein
MQCGSEALTIKESHRQLSVSFEDGTVNQPAAPLAAAPLDGILGYLNFSQGKPDARVQKQLNEAFGQLHQEDVSEPWQVLLLALIEKLATLKASNAGPFRDASQAEAVLRLTLEHVLPAYREHHRDLLFHQPDDELFQSFFLARVFEAILTQGGPWDETNRLVAGTLAQLNDFVGYRPVAVLESRPKGEPYDHERVRPVPLYLRGVGAASGRYEELIGRALEVLHAADRQLLGEAYLDLNVLDELAFDPRAYDHGHPANRRPNHIFGEWDPHHLDNQGRHRRYVVRQIVLDALLARISSFEFQVSPQKPKPDIHASELLFESAAVLAGTMLMGTTLCGASPTTHDSTVSIGKLMPVIAKLRDRFYEGLLQTVGGAHGERLREEAKRSKQPFGGARQHLNQFLSSHRAEQLQQRHLALIFAVMGYPEPSREQAARIPAASVRILSEILSRLTTGQLLVDRHELRPAAELLPTIVDLLHRGIACGALVDPWNILGFQGQFPLFAAVEDSVQDPRVLELLQVLEQLFALHARVLSEAAAAGEKALVESVRPQFRELASWWDRFATHEVGDLPRVHGEEAAESAEHVAKALGRWRERGEQTADLAFWRDHLADFTSPKAFALVVDALLRKQDYRAAMGLLMNWLSQAEEIPLEEGQYSFPALAMRWMLEVTGGGAASPLTPGPAPPESRGDKIGESAWPLVQKFFEHLEANADTYWEVPELSVARAGTNPDEEEDNPFAAAYEGMTFKDSADDGTEGSVEEGGPREEFDLEAESDEMAQRVLFLMTVCRLWQIASRQARRGPRDEFARQILAPWKVTALHFQERLLTLLDAVHEHPIPAPIGTHESLVEYDEHRGVKEQLLDAIIGTCVEATLAVRALRGATEDPPPLSTAARKKNAWETYARHLGQAILAGDVDRTREFLPGFLKAFQKEPLLYVPLDAGGHPRQILQARLAQITIRSLIETLPRLGLLREVYALLKTARDMEHVNAPPGRKVTEFDKLFQAGLQAVVEAVVDSAKSWTDETEPHRLLVQLLEKVGQPFLFLWMEHSQTLRLSILETLSGEKEWEQLKQFVQRYGHDLFHARFMALGNLRGILHHGVGKYLDSLAEEPDPLHPVQLLEELDRKIRRTDAERWLEIVLQAVVENYEEYRDYAQTTTFSDYGENLHILLDFLRAKVHYEREAWQLRPLALVHEALARQRQPEAAVLWQGAFTHLTRDTAQKHVQECKRLEQRHGIVLRTVADRVEERFVRPLAVDRLCALIEPAMEAARPDAPPLDAFTRLQRELEPHVHTPTGVGLDVPVWLRRLEGEVTRVRMARTPVASLTQELFLLPRRKLTRSEIEEQVKDWEK